MKSALMLATSNETSGGVHVTRDGGPSESEKSQNFEKLWRRLPLGQGSFFLYTRRAAPLGPAQMTDSIHLSIIVPAYREEKRILPTLQKIEAYRRVKPFRSEVIIVDDCSPDGTCRVVEQFMADKTGYRLLRNEKNTGKGGSVRNGMLAAQGTYRLFSDADLSTPIEDADGFFNYFEGAVDGAKYDVVIGSRRVAGAHLVQRQPLHREASGRIFSLLVRALAVPGFYDTQCGFKMFTAAAAEQIFKRQTIPGFGFDVEILFIALNVLGYKIKEAPVHWEDSPATTVRLFRDSTRMFRDLLTIRKNNEKKIYQ